EFDRLLSITDFKSQARQFESLLPLVASGWAPTNALVFVAYFENQALWERGQKRNSRKAEHDAGRGEAAGREARDGVCARRHGCGSGYRDDGDDVHPRVGAAQAQDPLCGLL